MVNSDAQLFTIEGIAAALIMLITVYIVVNTTSVYTAGDTHINDMQLEVIGSDALKMMNTPDNGYSKSPLVTVVENNDTAAFYTIFNNTLNNRTGTQSDDIQFRANVSYVMSFGPDKGTVSFLHLGNSSQGLYGGEHAVHVSQWIVLDNWNPARGRNVFPECPGAGSSCAGKHAALVEVLLWRD
jgi:hypothetical protein